MEATLFKQQYMSAHTKLYRIAYRLVEDVSDAEDMVQETYIKLWNKRKELNQIENSESYAVVILRNTCLDFLRSRNKRYFEEIDDGEHQLPDHSPTPEKQLMVSENLKQVEEIIESLPDQQRQIIKLRHWDDHSPEEIEEITGLSSVNIRVILSRARKKIKDILDKKYSYEN